MALLSEREMYPLSRVDHSRAHTKREREGRKRGGGVSETKHRFSPDSFANLADAKYSIGLVYACLFSIYRAEVEIVARVYRAIFDPFLHPRRLTARRPVATACSNTPVRHPPLFTTSKRRRCFFPLRCSKNFIRSLSDSGSARFMKFGDDLKLPRRVREFSSVSRR